MEEKTFECENGVRGNVRRWPDGRYVLVIEDGAMVEAVMSPEQWGTFLACVAEVAEGV
jgi:hypothetical protein